MKGSIFYFVIVLILGVSTAAAGELRDIELKDGSIITGEVVSLSNGVFTIKSDTLGILRVDDSKVKIIRPRSSSQSAGAVQNKVDDEAAPLQHNITSEQEILVLIQSLQKDPEFQKLLEDPDVMKAVNAGNVEAFTVDPNFMKLLGYVTTRYIQK